MTFSNTTIAIIAIFLLTACTLQLEQVDQAPDITETLDVAAELSTERRYSEALSHLDRAIALSDSDARPLIEIGRIYLQQHRWALAVEAFEQVLRTEPNSHTAIIGLAEALTQTGQPASATQYWQQALALDDSRIESWAGLGQAYLAQQRYDNAYSAFTEANTRGQHPEAQWALAILTLPTDLAKSRAMLQQITTLTDQRDHLLVALEPFTPQSPAGEVAKIAGITMVQLAEWPLAHYLLDQAAMQQPNDPQIWAFLGYTQAILGLPTDAAFNRARDLDPTTALTPYFEGIALRSQGAYDAAIDQFLHALDLDPNNLGVALEMAQTLAEKGDYLSAEAWYQEVKKSEPESILYQTSLTAFYVERGIRITEFGLPEADRLVSLASDDARAHDLLGWARFQTGDMTGAESALRSALALEPEHIAARYHLGRVLTAMNRHDEADAEFARVVDWDTSGVYRDRILENP